MTDNTKAVVQFLKDNQDGDFTAADVAAKLGLSVRQVNGIFTSGIQNKEFGYRSEIEGGTSTKPLKALKLTDKGRDLDLDSVD